uniref:SH2 domain-containing protein n=1 Tax=Takifugu rubripes TaxID=31033 RepID=A0A3B5KAT9_TAKRU
MSSERVPSRSEVMGWGPYQLSEYLRKMNLSGCDKVVLKNSISGSRFVNMSENDLQKFPKLHAPLISKISAEISKDEKRGIFRKNVGVFFVCVCAETTAESQGWGEDEFEEFDDDYESPYSADEGESTEDYESPNDDMANDYEPPPSQPSEELKVGPSLPIGDSDYIGNPKPSHASIYASAEIICTWLQDRIMDSHHSSSRLGPKHNTFPLHNKKLPPSPGPPGPPSHHGDRYGAPHLCWDTTGSCCRTKNQIYIRASSSTRCFFVCVCSQELDPRWYVGQVSRGQAEGCLRDLHKDGAYLVRDSMRQLAGQPFTLMVFYQEKVYNIQIRQQNQQFLLGTGLKFQEPFPSVRDIIYHYSQFPLLLIDAKKRNMNQQNQCLLSDPAGYLMMTGQNWT